MIKEAMFWEKTEGGKGQCHLCAHECRISESNFGICGVRQNIKGVLYTRVYADVIAANIDPIEKKPLYHFLPGSLSYSIATIGCNFKCGFCQNWQISQASFKDGDRVSGRQVMPVVADLQACRAPACFLFSLGPDQTGRAITRIFRPGFFQKVSRTSVLEIYGVRTLLNGTLLPAPHIGQRNGHIMRAVRDAGFEVGIHCYNHYRWQDHVQTMALAEVAAEFEAARQEFRRIFGREAHTAGAAGWQSNAHSREVYDQAELLYSSDTRGANPFFPRIGGRVFNTLEIPSTLPTFDELMGRPEYPDDGIVEHYLELLRADRVNVFTLHAEIEGMGRRGLFQELLAACKRKRMQFVRLDDYARELLAARDTIPVCDQVLATIDGRSGMVAAPA